MPASPTVLTTLDVRLDADPSRTVIRPFAFGYPDDFADGRGSRMVEVTKRVLSLDEAAQRRLVDRALPRMRERHRNADAVFRRRFADLKGEIAPAGAADVDPEGDAALLLGAYFSQEYAFESAALFNPSIVPFAPEDDDPSPDVTRFVLSLRGIGEGHISSVTFRTGHWGPDDAVVVDPPSAHGVPPRVEHESDEWVRLCCDDSEDASETVIFPVLPSQTGGVEDLRLTAFTDEDGTQSLIGTYTAVNGDGARQEVMRGLDLRTFEMRTMSGRMAAHKGMALFPRRIDGKFVMLGRQDGERIWLSRSDHLHHWDKGEPLLGPKYPWEFVQMGNCGAPIEIAEGWLVFTHGVGLVRGYAMGACLLDKEDPSRVVARTPVPLLHPDAEQRGGYVPNVTYSCGALVRDRRLLVPYAVGDEYTTFAVGSVDDVLAAMEPA